MHVCGSTAQSASPRGDNRDVGPLVDRALSTSTRTCSTRSCSSQLKHIYVYHVHG